jgi:DtxR family Mn-dependent transcriptional regulator
VEPQSTTKRSQSIEEYLEAIYKLALGDGVTVSKLANELHISPPSVSQMLVRLQDAGLVSRGPNGSIALTERGRAEGARLVRRHRLSERFLTDYLNLPWDQVHDTACELEHALNDEVTERLDERLGHPRTCPHGNPIPDVDGRLPQEAAVALSELAAGQECTVDHISDERPEMLRYLSSLGLLLGTRVKVEGVAPFGGPFLISVGGARYALGREVAARIFVHDVHGRPSLARGRGKGRRRMRGPRHGLA